MKTNDHRINFGPITGLAGVAGELMLHLGHDYRELPDIHRQLETIIGDELLSIGYEVLADHGLAVKDSIL